MDDSTVDSEIQLGKFRCLALHLVDDVLKLEKLTSRLLGGEDFLEVHLDFLLLLGSVPPLAHVFNYLKYQMNSAIITISSAHLAAIIPPLLLKYREFRN